MVFNYNNQNGGLEEFIQLLRIRWEIERSSSEIVLRVFKSPKGFDEGNGNVLLRLQTKFDGVMQQRKKQGGKKSLRKRQHECLESDADDFGCVGSVHELGRMYLLLTIQAQVKAQGKQKKINTDNCGIVLWYPKIGILGGGDTAKVLTFSHYRYATQNFGYLQPDIVLLRKSLS